MLRRLGNHWKGLYTGFKNKRRKVNYAGMEALEKSLTLEDADKWCVRHIGATSYVDEQAAIDSIDEEIWGTNIDASDEQWRRDVQRMKDIEEFNS